MPSTSSPEPQCTPRSSVCFLKTHKCASSAMQNMLMRYGERHGLAFALPPFGLYLGNPAFFNRTQVMGSPPFDMLVHHTRFHEYEVRAVLKPDAVFVTIVREPAVLTTEWTPRESQQAVLGVRSSYVIRKSAEILWHLLVEDMVEQKLIGFLQFFPQNDFRRPMSSKLANELRAFNAVDSLRYEHFLRRFEQRVQAFGLERMEKELTLLEQRTQFWYQRCVAREVAADKRDKNIYTVKVLTLQLRNGSGEVCFWMTAAEHLFTKQLRFKQLYKNAGLHMKVLREPD
ncbi:galactosylceramide sulfotransferase-like [Amblyomma americanum]